MVAVPKHLMSTSSAICANKWGTQLEYTPKNQNLTQGRHEGGTYELNQYLNNQRTQNQSIQHNE